MDILYFRRWRHILQYKQDFIAGHCSTLWNLDGSAWMLYQWSHCFIVTVILCLNGLKKILRYSYNNTGMWVGGGDMHGYCDAYTTLTERQRRRYMNDVKNRSMTCMSHNDATRHIIFCFTLYILCDTIQNWYRRRSMTITSANHTFVQGRN